MAGECFLLCLGGEGVWDFSAGFGVFVCVLGEESRNRPGVNFRGFHGFWKRIPRGRLSHLGDSHLFILTLGLEPSRSPSGG